MYSNEKRLNVNYDSGIPSSNLLSMSTSTKCLYALVVSAGLLLTYLGLFLAARVDLKERARKAWSRLRGRLPRNTRILLQTLSYYLAVTRSTCEVIKSFFQDKNLNLNNLRLISSTCQSDSMVLSEQRTQLGWRESNGKAVHNPDGKVG